jgi:peptidoglycan/xylan/chitin deacetylase (PgdA/CDA1 family)
MRKILKFIISKSRILKPLKSFQQNKLIIFNYHRIRDINKPTSFDDTLFGPDAARFRQEMEWLKKETRILSEDELIDIIYFKKPIKEICSMVTFDDGYRDNYDIAYPILKELEIPAIFFIPTHHISERQVGWWDTVAFLFKNTTIKKFNFLDNEYEITDRKKLINKFVSEIKCMETGEVENFIINLAQSLGQTLPEKAIQSSELMTWEQVKILSDNGMGIGSHSHDHSILSKQNNETLKLQLDKSIQILSSVLNKEIKSIAYPVGGYDHFSNETKNVSRDIGFKLGFSYLTGINQWGKVDPFDVKRMGFQREWLNLDMPLAFPNLFLKSHFKNI